MFATLGCHTGTDQQFGAYKVISSRPVKSRELCYFAGYSWFLEYPDYIFYYLEKIRESGFEIVFISSSGIGPLSVERLENFCSVIIEKENKGVDFGAWKIALELTGYGRDFDTVLLSNDSIMGPFFDLKPIYRKFKETGSDFFGLTRSFQRGEHIQSYFIYLNNNILTSEVWRDFWTSLKVYPKKEDIVDNYEIYFSRKLKAAGFQYEIWSDWDAMADPGLVKKKILKNQNLYANWEHLQLKTKDRFIEAINPCAFYWKELITSQKFPFLKRELIIFKKLNIEYDVLKNWKDPVLELGYNTDLISQVLSLGEIRNIFGKFSTHFENYEITYFYPRSSTHFTNFILIFPQKEILDQDSNPNLKIKDPATGRTYTFNLIYLSEDIVDRFIEDKNSLPSILPETDEDIYNLVLPYTNEVIPYLNHILTSNTALFRNFEEYECVILTFIQQVLEHSRNTTSLPSLNQVTRSIDISDLRSVVSIPSKSQDSANATVNEESVSFFELLKRYHTEYEALPMWYKKIGQIFKIMAGHKKIKVEFRNRRFKVSFRHKITVSELDKARYVKNWYYHEYDVLPKWYKKFGKLINKNKRT